ncbi:bifunctional 4'-phosphopantothenoylcysteine decarboxylase/phosphopantothenoylcysteine synthetase [Solemya pervernicosa gill symbiont]|uniref:Coenzyme A biosynthesis bifunctional protein CoaBC n=2 Tax=Gammaproteobacteria incertae sedis TaxID=118884 RepID=A0A1T2L484_9GAMM|nr:bifunctional phosphopantothenoylcysteine decarboxylase/phosphopantothenate--cysteine ligase CoaBC [Candidatus Reidiella endopervernicosa]OOZ39899.1 bifunctional 4'-phosphopantothenoylcysteine decarboxylase/phosphopantothenoylcysteine synthetase [Solemya pervernicosa gill symbiont]QKQ25776.1 bifunctional phosphopantothenoylcysteine decarboxylase/phosphopantothenate--cysteine ligase CoaBC [Candidatus Reidiella endopervernicosa]
MDQPLNGQKILLGITGGIAAYKCPELVRLLRGAGAEVRVVMSEAAESFVTPLTLQALSDHPVHSQLLDSESEAAMGHIELARWANLILVAPTTANFMAKLVHGGADDLLTTLVLAAEAPLLLAPAMNRVMWQDEATQANARILLQRGIELVGPDSGEQACGEVGPGRMVEPSALLARVVERLVEGPLNNLKVVVTAGPTREPIDPVRYITNRSSGRMGFAVAEAAAAAGAEVVLVAGPVVLSTPAGVERIDIESAAEMERAVMAAIEGCDIFVATAAVADYRPAEVQGQKMKKSEASLSLSLERTNDILAGVAALDSAPFTVGFAAETDQVLDYARDKLEQKRLDMIAANRVGLPGSGFDSDDNSLHLLWQGGEQLLEQQPKRQLARTLINVVAERFAVTQQR